MTCPGACAIMLTNIMLSLTSRRIQPVAIFTGMAMGMMAGLLGVGGGIVAVPLMTAYLALSQHEAHGTSLAAIVPASLFSVLAYAWNGTVDWGLAASLATGSLIGVAIGSRIMMKIPARQLRRGFGVFLLFVALRLFLGSALPLQPLAMPQGAMLLLVTVIIGLVAGTLAGMLGIGGGVIMVPAMVLLLGVEQRVAQGVSLAVVAVTAISGAAQHYQQGNVRLDKALWIAPTAAVFGFVGGSLAGMIDQRLLQVLFGLLLLIVGGRMAAGK